MSRGTERIPVPTNGRGPQRVEEPVPPTDAPPFDQATVAFTPTQLAVGFGILASLVLLLAGRIRRRGRSGSCGRSGGR